MQTTTNKPRDYVLTQAFDQDYYLTIQVKSFLADWLAQNLSPGTVYFYRTKLRLFTDF